MSNRRQKFVAESRIDKALKDLQLIGNLLNQSALNYDDADVLKIFHALQKGVESAKARFKRDGAGSSGEFRL